MKDKLFKNSPLFIQNAMITVYNIIEYKKRYGGNYKKYRQELKNNRSLSRSELLNIQKSELDEFLTYVYNNNSYFKKHVDKKDITELSKYPILSKENFRKDIKSLITIDPKEGIISKTGGTTGKSLKVYYTHDDMQKRFAFLDDFRSRFGYELGKKTAWFSGKALLTEKDVKKNRFWKTDNYHKVRYYSTFHIKDDYLKHYVEDIIKFKPGYLVGFPSTILDIAKYGLKNNYDFPANTVKAIFPTAETITTEMREFIEPFFKAKMYNQYASSEGAPFIFECENGNLHLELQSGTFEVLNDENQPSQSGKLVTTSFSTHGTPLVRYDIGDSITLDNLEKSCECGNNNPLVKEILGRIDDYIYSPENGKINLGNVSNTLKDTKGILKFKVYQDRLDTLDIQIVKDKNIFNNNIESIFLQNWRDRVGDKMTINLTYVNDIPVEKSGKFRIVQNNIKHLI